MSQIKNKDTKPEVTLRKALFARGFRYRVNIKTPPGKPDIVLPRYKTVIFVHGCFWHGHPGCKYAYIPRAIQIWVNKISGNQERDAVVKRELIWLEGNHRLGMQNQTRKGFCRLDRPSISGCPYTVAFGEILLGIFIR